ncbi:MAG: tyrosine-type recombinase/integrase [Acidobacteria bacterium]|nr:tyrosine-type recombinase/integrase [Acidobacteriota bacterium]
MMAAGLKGVSLHSLRHTFASELLSKGVPITEVSERLGHADKNITLAIYSHAMPADSRAAAKVWNEALGDVIQASKKAPAARTLHMVARKARKRELWLETKGVIWRGRRGSNPRPPT